MFRLHRLGVIEAVEQAYQAAIELLLDGIQAQLPGGTPSSTGAGERQ